MYPLNWNNSFSVKKKKKIVWHLKLLRAQNGEVNVNAVFMQPYRGFEADAPTGTAEIFAPLILDNNLQCSRRFSWLPA